MPQCQPWRSCRLTCPSTSCPAAPRPPVCIRNPGPGFLVRPRRSPAPPCSADEWRWTREALHTPWALTADLEPPRLAGFPTSFLTFTASLQGGRQELPPPSQHRQKAEHSKELGGGQGWRLWLPWQSHPEDRMPAGCSSLCSAGLAAMLAWRVFLPPGRGEGAGDRGANEGEGLGAGSVQEREAGSLFMLRNTFPKPGCQDKSPKPAVAVPHASQSETAQALGSGKAGSSSSSPGEGA